MYASIVHSTTSIALIVERLLTLKYYTSLFKVYLARGYIEAKSITYLLRFSYNT